MISNSSSRKIKGGGENPVLGEKGENEERILFPTPSKQCIRFLRTKHQHRVVMGEKRGVSRLFVEMAEK